jgi:hypothetical protein
VPTIVERQFSEFLRQPNEVVAELVEHDVVLRRRGAPALRLSRADRDESRAMALIAVTKILRTLVDQMPAVMSAAVTDVFPFATFLPEEDRKAFFKELTQTLAASADLDNFARVAQLIKEWRATANVHAEPTLAARLQTPIRTTGGEHRVRKPESKP